MRLLVCTVLAGALAGCGLGTDGLGPVDAGEHAEGSAAADAGPGEDGPGMTGDEGGAMEAAGNAPDDGAAGACLAMVPAGWSVVAYETTAAACPAGYGAAHDEHTGASAGASACPCSCQITAAPNCTQGTVTTYFGNGAGCAIPGQSITVDGSACAALSQAGTLAQTFSAHPIVLTGGACSGVPQPDPSHVTSQAVRTCDVPPPLAGEVCEGAAPSGFASCIESAGDVTCPAGTPFTTKAVVADGEMLSCSACASCSLTGTCASPQNLVLFRCPVHPAGRAASVGQQLRLERGEQPDGRRGGVLGAGERLVQCDRVEPDGHPAGAAHAVLPVTCGGLRRRDVRVLDRR